MEKKGKRVVIKRSKKYLWLGTVSLAVGIVLFALGLMGALVPWANGQTLEKYEKAYDKDVQKYVDYQAALESGETPSKVVESVSFFRTLTLFAGHLKTLFIVLGVLLILAGISALFYYNKVRWSLDDTELTILALPTFAWYIAFCYVPMYGIILAFKAFKAARGKDFLYSLLFNSKWCGLDNFEYIFAGGDGALLFRNTLGYNIIFIILGVVLPVVLAILISQMYSKKFAKVLQTAMFLPYFLSWVVVSYFIFAFLATDNGLVNRLFGLTGKNWYSDVKFWPYFFVFLNVWKGIGYSMVVYLAAITGIDGSLYEAALIDGATKMQQTKYITLPMLKTMMTIMFILAIGNIVRTDFGLFYQAPRNSGSLYDVATTLDVYVYKAVLDKPNFKVAAASGFLQSSIGLVMILATNAIANKIDPDTALF